MPPRPGGPLRKLGLTAAAFVLTLFVVELALRGAGYEPVPASQREGHFVALVRGSDHPHLTYVLEPNGVGRLWDTRVAINSRGLRDAEYELEKRADTPRIVALGDSVTFGNGLEQRATWPEVLERRFARTGPAVEVLNMGVAGYNTLEEVALLEQAGLAFDPDVVVVQVHVNDLGACSIDADVVARSERYRSPLYASRLAQLLGVLLDRRALSRQLSRANEEADFAERYAGAIDDLAGDAELRRSMERLERRLAQRGDVPRDHRVLPWYASAPRVGRLRHALRRLAALREAGGFETVAFVLPCFDEAGFEPEYELAYAILEHELDRAGVRVVPLRPALQEVGHGVLREDSWHPNERGHEVIADRVGRYLADEGLIEPGGGD